MLIIPVCVWFLTVAIPFLFVVIGPLFSPFIAISYVVPSIPKPAKFVSSFFTITSYALSFGIVSLMCTGTLPAYFICLFVATSTPTPLGLLSTSYRYMLPSCLYVTCITTSCIFL